MTPKKYNESNLDTLFRGVHEKLEEMCEKQDEQFEQLLGAIGKINGRVRTLENWRASIAGGLAVVTLILVPVAIKVFL